MATSRMIDFSNVKDASGFAPRHVPAGDYLATVTKVEDSESKKDNQFQYLFTIKLKKFANNSYPYYCKLQENQLWKLRNLLIAAGLSVPKKKLKLDPNRVVGKTIGVTMEDDEYDGKLKSVIAAVFPAAELVDGNIVDDEPEDDEADVDEDEEYSDDEDVEEDSADEFEEMDRSALKKYIAERQDGFKAKKSQSDDDLREIARSLAAPAAADDDEDIEDEEDEPAPPKKKAKGKAKPKPAVDDDELEELDIDDL